MEKQYIEPKLRVIEIDNASLIADSPGLKYGRGPGSGSIAAKECVWDEDEEW